MGRYNKAPSSDPGHREAALLTQRHKERLTMNSTTPAHKTLSSAQHSVFYDLAPFPPDAPSEVTFDLGLGEALEYLHQTQDMLRAATGAIETTVHP
jgi:hypothetical protein